MTLIDNQKRDKWWEAWCKKHTDELSMLFGNHREAIEAWCLLAFKAGWNSAAMFEKGGDDGA